LTIEAHLPTKILVQGERFLIFCAGQILTWPGILHELLAIRRVERGFYGHRGCLNVMIPKFRMELELEFYRNKMFQYFNIIIIIIYF
jgi:hypothetical protein